MDNMYRLEKILDRYGKKHADDLNTLDLQSKSLNYSSHHELLELVESKLVESIVDVSVDSLVELEDHLETALSVTRAQKAELMLKLVESLKEKENLLKEENQVLASQIEKKKLEGAEADNIEMSSGQISNIKLPVTLPLLN
ncbi:MADS-box protein FLOWERING LOCUS C-like [Brassica napus]|nr:MADS-box protein FLOWERING LOCUS C-like [Brassica napus]